MRKNNDDAIGNHLELAGFYGWPYEGPEDGKEDHPEDMNEEEEEECPDL